MDALTTLPTDSFVAAAFAELLEDVTNLLRAADGRDERTFWRRAADGAEQGAVSLSERRAPAPHGRCLLLPSATSRGLLVYRLTKLGGILTCDCQAGQKGILCYHHMLINVLERAAELESREQEEDVSGSGPDDAAHAAQLLSERLAATAAIIDAMRAEQQRPPLAHIGQRLAQARRVYLEAA